MTPIERYNAARDREQEDFDRSRVGRCARDLLNSACVARLRPKGAETPIRPQDVDGFVVSLAAEVAFGRSMPAFYAGRALRLW